MYSADLLEAQRNHERMNAELGALKYLDAQERKADTEGFDKRDDVQKMIRGALPILTAALEAWLEAAKSKKGRPHLALAPLTAIKDINKISLAALSKAFQTIALKKPIAQTAIAIGRALQVELEGLAILETGSKEVSRFLKLIEGGAGETRAAKRHDLLTDQLQLGLQWGPRTQYLVGGTILNVLLESLDGIFERDTMKEDKQEVPILKLTEEALGALSEMADAVAWTRPILRPMIVPPRKWMRHDTGAYLEPALCKTVPLVRTYSREHQKLIRDAIKSGAMQPCLDAINGIQETRFAIDKRVLEVMKWVRKAGLQPSASFPLSDLPELPKKMAKEEWDALPIEARIAKSRERGTKRNIRAAAVVNMKGLDTDLWEATRLSAEQAFFLPHSMDSRGRVYAVPHFNPQRSDHIKALFRFADAVPMGAEGGKWLAIHLANCGDFEKMSKKPFPQRVQWVKDNEELILECARNPQGSFNYWRTADSPFCFLQACFEWAEYAASGYSQDYLGTIAVALDGSCSGLQHYSAMNRAEEEGYHVNLLPRPDVGDIYNVVASAAVPVLEAMRAGGDEAARIVLAQGCGRSTFKRNTMTYFYGSGVFGMRDQHMVDLMRPLADDVALGKISVHPYSMMTDRTDKETGEVTQALDGGFTCAALLAKTAHQAIVKIAPKADEAATWFQGVAALLAHESLSVIWNTPMGLPVVQRYSEYTSARVNLWLYDRSVTIPTGTDIQTEDGKVLTRIRALLREAPTKRIDKKKARSAIAPNVVHSLDAAHLQRVVTHGMAAGLSHFQLIHDSFGTHAGNTEAFSRIIREAFVEQYETYCPFEALETYARSVLSEEGIEKLDALNKKTKPARGNLDLREVLKAEFAFA